MSAMPRPYPAAGTIAITTGKDRRPTDASGVEPDREAPTVRTVAPGTRRPDPVVGGLRSSGGIERGLLRRAEPTRLCLVQRRDRFGGYTVPATRKRFDDGLRQHPRKVAGRARRAGPHARCPTPEREVRTMSLMT